MEANPNGMDNGNGDDHQSEPAGIDLQYFIVELCKIACIPITGINIFSQSVGKNILKVLRDSSMKTTRFQAFVSRLSDITDISTVGEDVCSQSFMDSLLEYFQDQHQLVEGFRASLAERRTFRSGTPVEGNRETDQPLAHHSKAHSSSLESLETPKENHEVHAMDTAPEDVDVKPVISQIIPIVTSSVPKSSQLSPQVISTTPALQQNPLTIPLQGISTNQVAEPVPSNTDTASTTPVASSTLEDGGHQSGFPSLEDLGGTNETEVGTGSRVVNSMLDEIIETPVPSTSHQCPPKERESPTCTNRQGTCADKRRKKKKIHKASDSIGSDKFYHCSCGSKFKSKIAYKYHIKYFNAQWKFKCERCTKRFYDLSRLKTHLKKEHGEENPLKDFVIGCTLCGSMFKTRIEFRNHKKREHNIHNIPVTTSPKRASKPQNLKMEQCSQSRMQDQHEVIDLVSDDEGGQERNEGGPSPPQPNQQQSHHNSLMNGSQGDSGNLSVETSPGLNGRRGYGECYGCIMCTHAFGDPQQLRDHLRDRHQSERYDVKCCVPTSKSGIVCGIVFSSSRKFHDHRNQKHKKVNK